MNVLLEKLGRHGFDAGRLPFALRTALACCLAIVAAWLLGLEHPQWSGMTVWAASQPTRGHLIEKSFYRMAGTVAGSVFGTLLLFVADGAVPVLVIGLALWCALCTCLGNVQRGFTTYGTILAGCSAAMVALLGSPESGNVLALGIDRMLTVLTGVVVALLVGLVFARRTSETALINDVRHLAARVLDHAAARLRSGVPANADANANANEEHALLAQAAAIEDTLDGHGAGSLRARRKAQAIRALLCQLVPVLLALRPVQQTGADAALAKRLQQAAQALDAGCAFDAVRDLLAPEGQEPSHPLLRHLHDGFAALASALAQPGDGAPQREPLVVVHRDWITARRAGLRAGAAIAVVGLLWWITGWHAVAYMMLGTSLMSTIFSSQENPARTMHAIIAGQIMGVTGALACRWLAWPFATSELQLLLMIVPFSLLGAFLISHRVTMKAAFDYNMVMLLLLQPALPLTGSFAQSLGTGIAVLCAPLLAYLGYRFIYPTDARRRRDALVAMMVRDLEAMAAAPQHAASHDSWRAQLYHRLLRLTAWNGKVSGAKLPPLDTGATVLMLGSTVARAQELLARPGLPAQLRRRLRLLLERVQRIGEAPELVAPTLRRAAALLSSRAPHEAEAFHDVAERMASNWRFFRRGAA